MAHWSDNDLSGSEKELIRKTKPKKPKMCEECGKYPADIPGCLCAGCEAYREHQT
jgi:hypothetical protein